MANPAEECGEDTWQGELGHIFLGLHGMLD